MKAKVAKAQRKRAAARKKETAKPACGGKNSKAGGGRFQLQGILGSGGMCDVFEGLDLHRLAWSDSSPKVAVKRLLPELAHNTHAQIALAQEFFTLRHLVHPGIIRVYDLHEEPWGICFTMELLEGQTLYELQAAAPQGMGRGAIPVLSKLFDALAYLHTHGVVHADVKPANIFLVRQGRVVLFDFNVSQVVPKPGAACSPIAQGLRANLRLPAHSLLHASPERIETGRPSMADDVFSACCTAYELMHGIHPFKGMSSVEAKQKSLEPAKPAGVAAAQWSLLRSGLSFDPTKRPQISELATRFKATGILSSLLQR